jgi:arginyl-tRNA synthetase
MSLSFVKAFEIYQIRWNIEVLNKENKQYLKLGSYQGQDFDGQIADCTLCFLTYTVMVLEKRFSDYETLGELFSDMEEDVMSLTLWKRILACLQRLMTVLCERLGVTFDELAESFLYDEEAAAEYKIMAKALEESRKRA